MWPVVLVELSLSAVWIWLALNSAGLCLLAVVQYVTLRQIGIMLGRLAPLGARSVETDGPRAGEVVESQMAHFRSRMEGGAGDIVYLFASKSCSICTEVRRSGEELARHWNSNVQIVMIYDDLDPSPAHPSDNEHRGLWIFYGGRQTRELLGIDGVPFGIRVDPADRVLGKGLVNTISHVESLLELDNRDTDQQTKQSPVAAS